jgi:hypothetical protein
MQTRAVNETFEGGDSLNPSVEHLHLDYEVR